MLLPIRTPALLALAVFANAVAAGDWRDYFKDSQDGRFDTSAWLLSRHGFLLVPIVVTEPAVGNGGGAALVFFHRTQEQNAASSAATSDKRPPAPPSLTAVFGAATENGTKIAGAGHLGIWRDDTMRFTGGVAHLGVNVKFYGGADFPRLHDGLEYSVDGWGASAQLLWRWQRSNFWYGVQTVYLDASTGLEESDAPPIFDRLEGDIENTGAGIVLSYDGRDNIFTPNRGLYSEWKVREHWGEFLDKFEYTEIDGKNRWYWPMDRWTLAWRLDTNYTTDETPFYALPSIVQRGIARGRYQGRAVAATEFESRYGFDSRWFGVAFAGVGRAADALHDLDSTNDRWAGGVGVRYLIARVLGLQMGLDVARGPEEWTYYIQVGSGWTY